MRGAAARVRARGRGERAGARGRVPAFGGGSLQRGWEREPGEGGREQAKRGRGTVGRNKERRYRDKGSESVTKNPYRSLLVLRRCVLKQHCLARERHPERSLPAPMEHCHFASGARQLWRGAPTRNETRIERGRRRRRRGEAARGETGVGRPTLLADVRDGSHARRHGDLAPQRTRAARLARCIGNEGT
ncbi:unnamed protein product [Prorocentrum cordatum]|uniref:Uncharacterized protein n=2 Tax=Prorocentrum cordatum TaxID=2364126 RepID=A0ABN9PZF4_9DINO|nr:unnamed protein product [Polarella glacialis]